MSPGRSRPSRVDRGRSSYVDGTKIFATTTTSNPNNENDSVAGNPGTPGAGPPVIGESHKNGIYPYFCIDHFEGFFASAEPKILDTALIPDIKVRLHMSSNNVIVVSKGVGC